MSADPFAPNQQFYDRIAHCYDSIAHANERQAAEAGLAALAAQPGESILEIGYPIGIASDQGT